MPRIHRLALAATLLLAPPLMVLSEIARLRVEGDIPDYDDPAQAGAAQIAAISGDLSAWRLHGWLEIAATLALAGAILGVVAASASRRPLLSLFSALIGGVFVIGKAMHIGFYAVALDLFASAPSDLHDAAAHIWAEEGNSSLAMGAVAMFMLAALVTPFFLAVTVFRARLAPAWLAVLGALGWLVGDFLGSPWGLSALFLLLMFVPAARVLAGDSQPATEAEVALA